MKKDILRMIKGDMREIRRSKKECQACLKSEMREIKRLRKEELANGDAKLPYIRRLAINQRYDTLECDALEDTLSQWHNDQSYYLIYSNGDTVWISAEDILAGEPFPKMRGIVYAEMSTADDHVDTESGDLNWYAGMADLSDDEIAEREEQYHTAIEVKYQTAWGVQYLKEHPDFDWQAALTLTAAAADLCQPKEADAGTCREDIPGTLEYARKQEAAAEPIGEQLCIEMETPESQAETTVPTSVENADVHEKDAFLRPFHSWEWKCNNLLASAAEPSTGSPNTACVYHAATNKPLPVERNFFARAKPGRMAAPHRSESRFHSELSDAASVTILFVPPPQRRSLERFPSIRAG